MTTRGLMTAMTLAFAVAAPAAALPLDRIKLPEGFRIAVWAHVENARSLAVGDGFVVVGTRETSVHAVPFDRRTYAAGTPVTVTDDLKVPNGVALKDGVLYIGEQHRIVRWGDGRFDPAKPAQKPVKVGPDLPDKAHHGWRYMAFGPDGGLYVTIGAPCNVCMPQGMEGGIIRVDVADGSSETVATGVRNSVGVAFHPLTRALFFTDNGADMMGDNVPPEELNVLTAKGQNFGYPWYGGGRARTRDFMKDAPPDGVRFPVAQFNAHTAALGVAFHTGGMFPAAYRNQAFVAQHGSWNRTVPIGYRIALVRMDEAGKVSGVEQFASGWLQNSEAWGRPVDIKPLPDGSMLVSDDHAGVIYRITYGN